VPRAWLLVILLAAGCTTATEPTPSAEAEGIVGGTLHAGVLVSEDDPPELAQWLLDPQLVIVHPFARCCLLRTLLSYEGRAIEEGGAELRPDLAEAMPEVSADGLTWTFRLRAGLRYAPPLEDREIVARDFITALERTVRVGEFEHRYVVEGMSEYRDGTAGTISGAQAPDDRTLVIRLTEPRGDFGHLVALPFFAPIPAEALEVHDEQYGGFLVASGPYMVEGAESLDHSDPEATPIGDLEEMALVRNPSWSSETDPLRPAHVDRIEIRSVPDRGEAALDAIEQGELDVLLSPMLSTTRTEIVADPELRPRLRDAPLSTLFFVPLNLALPPFDDVAVRRAFNAVVDRDALLATFDPERGSAFVPVAHAFPEVAVGGLLRDYVPGGLPAGGGDAEAAREIMAESAYDADGDGRCDGEVCTVVGNRYRSTTDMALGIIEANLAELGIQVEWVDEPSMFDPAARIGLMAVLGWGAEYPSANDFVGLIMDPQPGDTLNQSLIGATPQQLEEWGYPVTEVPSLDDKIGTCRVRSGSAAFECWAELDQLLSGQVAAWVPIARSVGSWLISDRVDRFEIAGSEALPALERVSLHPEAAP
jgi:peptide/nickel transport system substrate-binding protein